LFDVDKGFSMGCGVFVSVYGRSRVCVCACECVQRDGRTALLQASGGGKEEVVEVLMSSGAAANAAKV
jgi:hypothetical protein